MCYLFIQYNLCVVCSWPKPVAKYSLFYYICRPELKPIEKESEVNLRFVVIKSLYVYADALNKTTLA